MGKRITILLLIFAGIFWWASRAEKENQEVVKNNEPSVGISEETVKTEDIQTENKTENVAEEKVEDISEKLNEEILEDLETISEEDVKSEEKTSLWGKVRNFFASDDEEDISEKNVMDTENSEEIVEDSVEETKEVENIKDYSGKNEENIILETKKEESVKTTVPVIKSVTTTKTVAKNVGIKTVKNVSTPKAEVVLEEKEEVLEKPVIVMPPRPVLPKNESNVRVYIYENGIDFSEKNIPAGTVHFEVINTGRFSHEFIIAGINNFGKIPPRSVAEISVGMFPGTYEVYSDYRKDYERGVRDVIEVE